MKRILILLLFISATVHGQFGNVAINGSNSVVPTTVTVLGDSYFNGTGGFVSGTGFRSLSTDTTVYTRLFGATVGNTIGYNLTATSYALSGIGSWYAASQFLANVSPSYSGLTSCMIGYNDLRAAVLAATYRKIVNDIMLVFINHNLGTWATAGAGSGVTRTGTWTTGYAISSVGGKSGSNGAYTTTANDAISWTFTDSTVVFSSVGSDGSGAIAGFYNLSPFDVYIDNVLMGHFTNNAQYDGVTIGAYNNKLGPYAVLFTGLAYRAHTIRVVNKGAATQFFFADFFGTLKDASTSSPLLLWHVPYDNVTGYAGTTGSVTATQIINNKLDSLKQTWSPTYPVYMVPTEKYFDTLSCLGSDNIHPNNYGDSMLFNAAKSVLPTVSNINFGTIIQSGTGSRPYVVNNGVKNFLAYVSDFGSKNNINYILSNPGDAQSATINITGNITTQSSVITAGTKEGKSVVPTDGAFVAGLSTDLVTPFASWYRSGNASDQKIYQIVENSSGVLLFQAVTDNFATGNTFMRVDRSGATPTFVTFGYPVVMPPSITAGASINIAEGTAPSSPVTGDLWNTSAHNLFFRTNSTTYTVAKTLIGSATLDFPSTGVGGIADLTVTVTGAAIGDPVVVGVPNASVTATASFFAWVSATNTVTIRYSPKATEDPASGTFKVTVTPQ